MLVYGSPITDWAAALTVFAVLYTITMVGVWTALKVADRHREGGDAGRGDDE